MSKALVEIEGFEQLYAKIKKLPDSLKRRELLKIYGQVANPTLKAAKALVPVKTRNLQKSIKKRIGRKGINKVNAAIFVGPWADGKFNGWYGAIVEGGHNIYKKGFKRKHKADAAGHNASGAKSFVEGKNYMARAYQVTKGQVTADAERQVTRYLQRQINRL